MQGRQMFLYQDIAEAMGRRIASGELQPGKKLPPVREMARRWHCTPGTVGRAYAQLAREEFVVGHRGDGTRVASSALQVEQPTWGWASLINHAEGFFQEALRCGHAPSQAESALSVAIARWRELQGQMVPKTLSEASETAPKANLGKKTTIPKKQCHAAQLRFVGSHDLTVELLAGMLNRAKPQVPVSLEFVGSLGGLMAIARHEADFAGTHLWDEASDTYNTPFIRRIMPGCRVIALTLAHRSLGFITDPSNPLHIEELGHLAQNAGVRFVNCQVGSGTRVWPDEHLNALGISPKSMPGYDREELTHLAIARTVDDGDANVGVGIFSTASAFGLDFVPLTREQYDLVFTEAAWVSAAAQTLIAIIRSDRFKEAVTALGGYDTSDTDQETRLV